jgi:hypothetical protein
MRACRGRPVSGRGTLRQVLRRGRKAGGPPPLITRAVRQPPDLPKAGTGPRERRGQRPRRRRASECERAPPGARPWIPTTKCVGMTAGRGMASPRRRPRHAARAAGPWPKRGRPSPEPRQRRGASVAARSAAPVGGCLKVAAAGGQGRPGYGGKRAQEGRRAAHGGLVQGGRNGGSVAAAEGENYSSPTRRFRAMRRRLRHFFDAPPLCFFLSPNRNPTRNPSAPPCAALCAATLPLAPPSPQRCPRSGWLFGCSIQSGVALRFPPHSITDPPSVPLCALCGQHSPSPFAPFVSFVVGCSGCLSPTRPTGASTTDPFSVLLSGHFVFFVAPPRPRPEPVEGPPSSVLRPRPPVLT